MNGREGRAASTVASLVAAMGCHSERILDHAFPIDLSGDTRNSVGSKQNEGIYRCSLVVLQEPACDRGHQEQQQQIDGTDVPCREIRFVSVENAYFVLMR